MLFLSAAKRSVTLPPTGLYLTPLYPWLVWFLWKARNLLIFEKKDVTAADSLHRAIAEAKAWQGAQEAFPPRAVLLPLPQPTYLGPPGSISCFTDAACHADDDLGGLSWIFKDDTGRIIFQSSTPQDFIPSALAAEAFAVKLALSYARAADFLRLTCFSDCQELVLLLNSDGLSNQIQGLLDDIKSLSLSFVSVAFKFIPRALNSEADLLAKSSLLSWIPPSEV
ncbi:unnamed protein product [Microthlaspi erraticum]|uniref:RNase H type-1 domain-containing protein n=1 Tax=Microthlaspi erraticum TaxID=1685480 RepID=A0A6D2HB69_9BRAS|nr:unnamed protein product [Microthlaspi erraticum]